MVYIYTLGAHLTTLIVKHAVLLTLSFVNMTFNTVCNVYTV